MVDTCVGEHLTVNFLSSLTLFILLKTYLRKAKNSAHSGNKQIAHEQKRDTSLNALLIETTSASSSQDTLLKIHQRLPKFAKWIYHIKDDSHHLRLQDYQQVSRISPAKREHRN